MAGTRSPFDLTLAHKVPGDMPSLVNPRLSGRESGARCFL